jgi:phosphate transport system substrate-binding protein
MSTGKRKKLMLIWSLVLVLVLSLFLIGCEEEATTTEAPPAAGQPDAGQPDPGQPGGEPGGVAPAVRLTFAGSTTVQPLAQKLGDVYQQRNPNVELEIGAGGSRVGIEAVQNGTADIGMASRDLKEEEKTPGMGIHQIAVDVLAIIVNPANPVSQLSHEQLQNIYLGNITNWSELGGPDQPIEVVIREVTSGTRGAFDEIVLDDAEPVASATTQVTAGEVHTYVAEKVQAIGYVGFGHVGGDEVKVLSIDGVAPSPQSAMDGTYKLKRPLQLLTGPLSRPQAQSFVDFALSPEGQQVVVEDGWVPVRGQ